MKKEEHLGRIKSQIVGIQFYDDDAKASEQIFFEREPDNTHDKNAIRVENLDFKKVGFLPKKMSSWLSPLIDKGKVMIDGVVKDSYSDNNYSIPIEIKITLKRKGEDIFKKSKQISSAEEAFHEAVLYSYENIIDKCYGAAVSEFAELLKRAVDRNILPKTKLLLELFEAKVRLRSEQRIQETLNDLKKIRIGAGLCHFNLTFFPLFSRSPNGSNFISLDQAIKKKYVEVGEVSEEGDISKVNLRNKSDKFIFLPQGEMITGAKQDRVIIISTIVVPNTTEILNVSCVEQGRWEFESQEFKASDYSHPKLRKTIIESAEDIQQNVWNEVNACLSDFDGQSESSSLPKGMKGVKKQLKGEEKKIKLPKTACGVAVLSGEELLGIDFFDSPKTFSSYKKKLLQSYLLEGLKRKGEKSKKEYAEDLLKEILDNKADIKANPLSESVVGLYTNRLKADLLLHENRVCHLTAFEHSQSELNANNKHRFQKKPKKCPECNSSRIATILYGYPDFNEKLENDIELGRTVLGGCCEEIGAPKWQCADCGIDIFEVNDGQ